MKFSVKVFCVLVFSYKGLKLEVTDQLFNDLVLQLK